MVRVGVDGLSRPTPPKPLSEADRFEWQIAPDRWAWVQDVLAAHRIVLSCDRFANRANALLPRFCSLSAEPGALSPPNAFAHDWSQEAGWNWAFPPLREIPRVLGLVREQRARVVLVVPDWKQAWFAPLMNAAWVVAPFEGDDPFFRRLRNGA